jgi:glycerophosphoryl diester phosphodiesterase
VGAGVHENTQTAFEQAIAFGIDGIETDIRLSADAQPILFHDRLAPDDRPVESLTRRQLEEVVGFEIPTLGEILTHWPEVFWNLEIKSVSALEITIDLVKRHSRPEKILVSSFRHDVVLQFAERLDVACGLVAAHAPIDVPQMLEPWQAYSRMRTIAWDFNITDPQIVGQAHRCGFKVFVYGAVTPHEHEMCREWMLDGVITDFPDRARNG